MSKPAALLKSALNPARLPVMVKKLQHRFFDKKSALTQEQYLSWLAANAMPVDQWCENRDAALWAETKDFVAQLFDRYNNEIKPALPYNLGGNACVRLLYFMARYYKPQTIVETGVALGFSSQAFLSAIAANNGQGKLYSSDFPYFRLENAEKYIGIVVQEQFKGNWSLYIDGDDTNLPKIMAQVGQIDLFHYDSDKTYLGREKGFAAVKAKLSPKAVILFDDIQDNPHFHDFVKTNQIQNWKVLLNRDGGYIGLINNSGK